MTPTPSIPIPLIALRRQLRSARRAIAPPAQRAHARAAARLLRRWLPLRPAWRIALYLPNDGELDPRPLQRLLAGPGTRWLLPVLRRGVRGRLWFVEWRADTGLRPNRFGILEPYAPRRIRPLWQLDLVLLPLVGFDADGNRLGMGGGWYDRSLAVLAGRRHWRRPRLIGLAHECQRVTRLSPRAWDIPLDAVVTEARVYRARRGVA